jgi:hypothetical protein
MIMALMGIIQVTSETLVDPALESTHRDEITPAVG